MKIVLAIFCVANLSAKDIERTILDNFIIPKKFLRHYLGSNQPNTERACSTKYGTISEEELLILNKRKAQIRKNFQKFFNKNSVQKEAPNIAICTSGGGYRAMIATTCFLENLNEIVDITLYCSSLSGSAWAIGAWMSSNQSISKFRKNLQENITSGGSCISNINRSEANQFIMERLFRKHGSTRTFFKSLLTKYAFDQDISSTDIWGALIMHDILRHITNKQKLRLSDQTKTIQDGLYPIPLYAAVSPSNNGFLSVEYDWFEFSPIDVRNISTNAYVPTWAFAREFIFGHPLMKESKNGKLFPPELRISSYFGIFGSAFAINVKEAIKLTTSDSLTTKSNIIWNNMYNLIYNLIDFDFKALDITDTRLLPAIVYNPEYNPNIPDSKKKIHLIDAGLDFNLAIPPLLNRKNIDIIIVFDASSNYASGAPELIKAKNYADKKNFKFPNINSKNIGSSKISIFQEINCPTIIYVPFDNCCLDDFCGTFDFNYDTKKFNYIAEKAKLAATQVKNYLRKIL